MSTPPALELTVNGEPHLAPAGSTLTDLIVALGCDPRAVAVERNGSIVRRQSFVETLLVAGDRLEVVRFVQGG